MEKIMIIERFCGLYIYLISIKYLCMCILFFVGVE